MNKYEEVIKWRIDGINKESFTGTKLKQQGLRRATDLPGIGAREQDVMGSRLDFREGSSSEFLAGKSKEGDCRKIFFPPRERKVERMGKLGEGRLVWAHAGIGFF